MYRIITQHFPFLNFQFQQAWCDWCVWCTHFMKNPPLSMASIIGFFFWLILSELCVHHNQKFTTLCGTYAHQSWSSDNRCKNNYHLQISSDVPRSVTSISVHFMMICAWMCRSFMIDYCKIHFRRPFLIRSNRIRFQIDTYCNKKNLSREIFGFAQVYQEQFKWIDVFRRWSNFIVYKIDGKRY